MFTLAPGELTQDVVESTQNNRHVKMHLAVYFIFQSLSFKMTSFIMINLCAVVSFESVNIRVPPCFRKITVIEKYI